MSKLISRAKSGYSIRKHEDGTYQVFFGRVKPNSFPIYTSHDLKRAREWRDLRILGAITAFRA